MSIIGASTGYPPIHVSRAVASAKRPSTTMPMSAEVPPTSKVIVRRVQIREQKADRDRLDPRGAHNSSRLAHCELVERNQFLAARRHEPLGDRQAMTAPDQRPILPGNLLADRIMLRSLMTSDVDDAAIAGSGDHAGYR